MRRLPNGNEIDDSEDERYCDEWRKFAKPICEFTSWRLLGFGDGVSLVDGVGGQIVSLPTNFVEAFNKTYCNLDKLLTRLEKATADLAKI